MKTRDKVAAAAGAAATIVAAVFVATLPEPAPARFSLTWDYHEPMPSPDIVFELWTSATLQGGWSIYTVTNAPPVSVAATQAQAFFALRASNVVSGEVSGWSVNRE